MADTLDVNHINGSFNVPFPASTRQVAGIVNGIQTDVVSVGFSDKILITISQRGRLTHWVSISKSFFFFFFCLAERLCLTDDTQLHVPIENQNPGTGGLHTFSDATDDGLLPITNLTATTILGGHAPGQSTIGQLYARQIASAIAVKSPDEKRLLVVGMGLDTADADRDVFFAIIDLVLQCL